MKYESPEMKITKFSIENIVTLSAQGIFEAAGETSGNFNVIKTVDATDIWHITE